ncbi:MAG TPA: DUF2322 family protein [Methylophilaceae bacterium]|jgi:hypothetical protein
MKKFSDILANLEPIEHIQKLELFNKDGSKAGEIENKPGSAGSLKLYHHLWKKWGIINNEAAKDGLDLYAEHTDDAAGNPGKHPNIDRLFGLVARNEELTVNVVKQTLH